MTDSGLTVIFRTQSDIEANVVEALLDSHGVETLRTSGPTPGLFPFRSTRWAKRASRCATRTPPDAVRIIESHREQVGGGIVVPLPQEFDALEARIGYRFQRSRPARARADAQVQGARGSERRRRRQRVAGVPRRRGARPGRRRRAVPHRSRPTTKGRSRRSRRTWSRPRRSRNWPSSSGSAIT